MAGGEQNWRSALHLLLGVIGARPCAPSRFWAQVRRWLGRCEVGWCGDGGQDGLASYPSLAPPWL